MPLLERNRFGFHLPVTVSLHGRSIPAYFIHHHMSHAASSYYSSPFQNAAIMTHDGYADGTSYHSGMFYFGHEHKLYPLSPHHLNIGALYDRVGMNLQLGVTGPAGKLMGLAAYGKPRFFDAIFVGNFYDQKAMTSDTDITSAWLYHCVKSARKMGYDMTHYMDPNHATAPINADLAASTQKLFEEIRYKAVQTLHVMLMRNELKTTNLCLSGGTALNCPSNSQLYNEAPFSELYIEPCCDDGGLSIGAALAVYHNILDQPRQSKPPYRNAYLGARHDEATLSKQLANYGDEVLYERCTDSSEAAAQDIFENKVIGWYQGCSEAGPRALGHRSIIADPRIAENWPRVNRLKKREHWRPFAPAVLEEHVADWFTYMPARSPYMLFNARVKSSAIPAVTHVDGTARIQTVGPEDEEYYRLISLFHTLSKVPVVLNTSFNGPGEPIVETFADALSFFVNGELDVMYINQYRITKRQPVAKGVQNMSNINSSLEFSGEQIARCSNIELTEQLGRIWQLLFNDPTQRFSPHDDFFKIGGSSLLAITLIEKIKTTFEVHLSLKVLLKTATFAALAEHVATAMASKNTAYSNSDANLEHGVL